MAKARPMPTQERLGTDDRENLQDRRKPAIHLDEDPPVVVFWPDAATQFTPQNNQLMSKYCILRLKPALRPEWRGQHSQNETAQPDHSASLGDSITSSTRIRFSVHTAGIASVRAPRVPQQHRRASRHTQNIGDKARKRADDQIMDCPERCCGQQ